MILFTVEEKERKRKKTKRIVFVILSTEMNFLFFSFC